MVARRMISAQHFAGLLGMSALNLKPCPRVIGHLRPSRQSCFCFPLCLAPPPYKVLCQLGT